MLQAGHWAAPVQRDVRALPAAPSKTSTVVIIVVIVVTP